MAFQMQLCSLTVFLNLRLDYDFFCCGFWGCGALILILAVEVLATFT